MTFQSFDFERTWWRLFQKRVVRTKFNIYMFFSHCFLHYTEYILFNKILTFTFFWGEGLLVAFFRAQPLGLFNRTTIIYMTTFVSRRLDILCNIPDYIVPYNIAVLPVYVRVAIFYQVFYDFSIGFGVVPAVWYFWFFIFFSIYSLVMNNN